MDTDPSNSGVGAVLSQIQDNHERVTGYYSRCLNEAERNYCVTRKELLAVVVAVEHLNYFLYGRKFTISAIIKDMCKILGIHKTRTTSYHPESDGMVERSNRTIATQLSMFIDENQSDWDEHVDTVLMAYRTAVHESTGQTPAILMMGHELRVPIDLLYGKPPDETTGLESEYASELAESLERAHSFARNRLRLSSERMKRQYDRDSSKDCFQKYDNVWLYTPRKKKGLSAKF